MNIGSPKTIALYTARQVANLLDASVETVIGWMQAGSLGFQRLPDNSIRISEKHLVQFLKHQGVDLSAVMADAAATDTTAPEEAFLEPQEPDLTTTPVDPPAEPEPTTHSGAGVASGESTEPSRPLEPPTPAELVETVLQRAAGAGASHVHFEPHGRALAVKFRTAGSLNRANVIPQNLPESLIRKTTDHLLTLAGLDDPRGQTCLTGTFLRVLSGQERRIDLIAFPAADGWAVICRLHEPATALEEMLADGQLQSVRTLIQRRSGLILVAGSPNDGRRGLLQAMAREVSLDNRVGISLTGTPLPGYLHWKATEPMSTDAWNALTVAGADVVVADEIACPASARTACDLAREGTLVLAGLDAQSCPEALAILQETGMGSWPLAAALRGVVAVRSFRRLCTHCREVRPTEEMEFPSILEPREKPTLVHTPGGCEICGGSGYTGKGMFVSVLNIERGVVGAIRSGTDATGVLRAAEDFVALPRAALGTVQTGSTSPAEAARSLAS